MEPLKFDEEQIIRKLERLPRALRTAFAAACAERLLPAYIRLAGLTNSGSPASLDTILEHLWLDLDGRHTTPAEAQQAIDFCMSLIPLENVGFDLAEVPYAEDAVAALAYALRSRASGQAHDAAWAARRAYEAVDHFVVIEQGVDMNTQGAEMRVLNSPIIQAELKRQERDLAELLAAELNVARVASSLRERAKAESAIVFRSP